MKNKGAYIILILEIALISVLHAVKINQEEKPVVSTQDTKDATREVFHAGITSGHWSGISNFLQVPLFHEQSAAIPQ
jgi:hypothetical protein